MKAVVLLSGGVDSTVLLADRHAIGDQCIAVTFDYGQTHHREIDSACFIAAQYIGVEHRIINIAGALGGSALTGDASIPSRHAETPDATYVPGRNLVMIAIAASIAEQERAAAVLIGASADDFGGYPDCRWKFIDSVNETVSAGTVNSVSVHAPFGAYTKRDIIAHGESLNAPLHLTWSCYRGGEQPCGRCGACESLGGVAWRI
jgi:7-cyano-7-deazaguanine synthase